MIVSASRRTDIPAFYAEWFINRIRAGYCCVPNPFNAQQISKVGLAPQEVDVIVFWTRFPRPLLPFLDELDQRGYRYYFQYTLMNNPRAVDQKNPSLKVSLKVFQELADKIGADRIIWRYDPIVLSPLTNITFHEKTYRHIAQTLKGCTRRSVISIMDPYYKINKRLQEMEHLGVTLHNSGQATQDLEALLPALVQIAHENEMEIVSCAEELDLAQYGIRLGKCIDDDYINKIFGIEVNHQKDPSQRKACGCVVSKDIGMYNSCLFGCMYCYATKSFDLAKDNYRKHEADSPSLLGWHEAE